MSFNIHAMGLITSVGRDFKASCASMRAGITRALPIDYIDIIDLDSTEGTPAIGHPIKGITDGYSGYGRWLKMIKYAIEDMNQSFPDSLNKKIFDTSNTSLIVLLPSLSDERFAFEPVSDAINFDLFFLKNIVKSFDLPILNKNIFLHKFT